MNERSLNMISKRANGIVVEVLAQPGSKTTGIEGIRNNRLKIRLAAKAVDGAANMKLREFLSLSLKVSKSSVTFVSGESSRQKTVFVEGDATQLSERLHNLING